MVVLVTGAAHRLGRAISLQLAQQGHCLALHCRDSLQEAQQLAEEINSLSAAGAHVFQADLLDSSSLKGLFHEVAAIGPVQHLINNASIFERDTISTITSESFDKAMAVNLKAPLLLSKEFISHHYDISTSQNNTTTGGSDYPSIVNILDQKIASTNADNLSYTLSKHGLHSLTEMLAKESSPKIRVNAVAPGPILPHAMQSSWSFQQAQDRCLLKYNPSERDVAEAVSYLLCSKSITGQTIYVDCGDRFVSRQLDTIE